MPSPGPARRPGGLRSPAKAPGPSSMASWCARRRRAPTAPRHRMSLFARPRAIARPPARRERGGIGGPRAPGKETTMDGTTLEAMRTALRGPVIGPQDPGYREARTVYNAMIDRRPAAVVRCADAADVMAAVGFIRDEGLELAVRGGGHSGGGLCLVDDGVTLDLSPMRWAHIDPSTRTARVGGGSRLADLDHAAHGFGLATPAGIQSTTGIGG